MTEHAKGEPQDLHALALASALIRARSDQGMTQAELAEKSGVSRSAIKGYETARNMPGTRELKALCRTLRVSPNMLLFGVESPALGEGSAESLDALLHPESIRVMAGRVAAFMPLLTGDERRSVFTLVHSLAIARHGPETVRQTMESVDLLQAMASAMLKDANAGAKADTGQIVADVEGFMERAGHPEPKSTK